MVTDISTAVVKRCRNEQEAAIVVAYLNNAGIEARSEGALTSAMRTEVAQDVSVVVFGSDLARAREVLQLPHQEDESSDIEQPSPSLRLIWFVVAIVFLGISLLLFVRNVVKEFTQ